MSPIIYIGNGSVGVAVGLSLFGIISFYAAKITQSSSAASFGRGAVYGNFILMTVANLAMVYALLSNDFSVSYVAHVGARETPRWISAISLWSSLEGSILFWGWILTGYSAVCIYLYREKQGAWISGVGLTLLAIQGFFYLLLALPANPFRLVDPVPFNGPGPNPLLQNHWLMALHPPCLYLGYIGFTVPFAFAIASLWGGDESWVKQAKPWILFAWSFLSMAIVLGGWWSYAVLGWGGYWAWDPVENASFMPWLSGTALVHSVMVREKRRLLSLWNLSLAILTFLLTILGTFLTRSGVLDSVHSFTESHVGPYFLAFIGIAMSVSVALLLWKGPSLRREGPGFEKLLSLEVLFLFNNLLFLSLCFVVLLGTLYPLIVEAVKGTRISVGEPYFNQMTAPIVGMILLLMGIGWRIPWRGAPIASLLRIVKMPFLLAFIPAILCMILGGRHPGVVVVVYLASFTFLVMAMERKIPPRRFGAFTAHLGALIVIVAVALSKVYERDQEIVLKRGERAEVKHYSLTLSDITRNQAPQRFEIKAVVEVEKKGQGIGSLTPQMNFYPNSREPIGSPAIRSTLMEDLYLTVIHFEKDGSAASLRVKTVPAVAWIWIGGVLVMAGGLGAAILSRISRVNV